MGSFDGKQFAYHLVFKDGKTGELRHHEAKTPDEIAKMYLVAKPAEKLVFYGVYFDMEVGFCNLLSLSGLDDSDLIAQIRMLNIEQKMEGDEQEEDDSS